METESKKSWIKIYEQDKDKAWETFLEQFNRLILAYIRKHVQEYDEAMEVYTFVLEKMKEKDCQRLTSYFQAKRQYNFEAWVVVVSRNCMFDWFRANRGRKRLLKCIESLPEIDQLIFRYIHQQRYTYSDAYEILKSKNGFDLSFEEMYSRSEEIFDSLQQKTRWRLLNEWQSVLPSLPLESLENPASKIFPKKTGEKTPEEDLSKAEVSKTINDTLQKLSIQDRLIVDLHLYQGLTLKEIAGILKEKKEWKVRRKFYKALQIVKDSLKEKGIKAADLDFL